MGCGAAAVTGGGAGSMPASGDSGAGVASAAASGERGGRADVPSGSAAKLSTSFFTSAERIEVGEALWTPASVISSTDFFRSAISASRIASWNWPWNSDAMRRILPMYWPTVRSTAGSSFGPMAISATTAMTTSSLQPISNMASLLFERTGRRGAKPSRPAPL